MTSLPPKTSKPHDVRLQIDREPITYLALANGHLPGKECTVTDLVQAAVYTANHFFILTHPECKIDSAFQETCRLNAEWLFEPATLAHMAVPPAPGATLVPAINLASEALPARLEAFLQDLPAGLEQDLKLQLQVPKGLWQAVKAAYGFKHGRANEQFCFLLMGLLMQKESLEA